MKTNRNTLLACHIRRPLLTALTAILAVAGPLAAQADVVSDWNETTENIVKTKNVMQALPYAMVHLAMYDAVNAIDGKFTPYAIVPQAPTAGASQEAAAAAAAYTMLYSLFPRDKPALTTIYTNALAAIPDGQAETRGVAIGTEVALGLLELRKNDGRDDPGSYTFSYEPGDYQTTPPNFSYPAFPAYGNVKPFALPRGARYRAPGPPALSSWQYQLELNEVKNLGSATSTSRTPEQTETAKFYFEGPATFWTHNYRAYIRQHNLSTTDAARLWAMLMTSFADSSISCWDSKYYYNFWRPVTAIHNADTDGNPLTAADPNWQPLSATPPFPEYPSGHACITSAMNAAMQAYYGYTFVPMTLTSSVPGTIPRHFENLQAQTDELINARVWAGFHFRSASVAGADLGGRVGRYVASHFFMPVNAQ